MTTPNHYREAESVLKRISAGPHPNAGDLAKAQLHAMLAVADELRGIHNELTTMRALISELRYSR